MGLSLQCCLRVGSCPIPLGQGNHTKDSPKTFGKGETVTLKQKKKKQKDNDFIEETSFNKPGQRSERESKNMKEKYERKRSSL